MHEIEYYSPANQIFGHTGMKGGGNTASWADYPGTRTFSMRSCTQMN